MAADTVQLSRLGATGKPAVKKKKKELPVSGGIWILVIIFTAGLLTWKFAIQPLQIKKEYLNTLKDTKNQPTLEEKAIPLKFYIDTHFQGPYTSEANEKLKEVYRLIEDRDFDNMLLDIQLLVSNDYIADATTIYLKFLQNHPDSNHIKEIHHIIKRLPEIVEKQDYHALSRLEEHAPEERLAACRKFLSRHPEGRHSLDVKKMIADIHDEKFYTLQNQVVLNRQQKNWTASVLLCKNFLINFKGHPRTEQVREIIYDLLHEKDLADLEKQVARASGNPEALKLAYINFLANHPEAVEKNHIQKQLAKIEKQLSRNKNWQETLAYCQNNQTKISSRISHLKNFIRDNPSHPYMSQAESLLAQLEIQRQPRTKTAQTDQKKKIIDQQRARQTQERQVRQILEKQVITGLDKSGGRFISRNDGTVTDTDSGLMWCIADSHLILGGKCMTFDAALRYISRLSTGNYSDWRLATGDCRRRANLQDFTKAGPITLPVVQNGTGHPSSPPAPGISVIMSLFFIQTLRTTIKSKPLIRTNAVPSMP